MIEKECIENEIPFFSFEAGNRKLDLHIELDEEGNRFPNGCVAIKDYQDNWSEPTRVDIRDWTKTFVRKMGYRPEIDRKEIFFSWETAGEGKWERPVIAFTGPFGSLKIDFIGHFQCVLNQKH